MQYEIATIYGTLLEPYNIVFHFESLLDLLKLDCIDKTEG